MSTRFSSRNFFFITCTIAILGVCGPARIASAELPAGTGPFGSPRPWEGGMGVGPYSVVNLRTGHVLTTLHIVSWGGTGGGLSFNLYHNAPDDNSGIEVTPDMEKAHDPFDPITEPIWRTSFSSSLVDNETTIDLTRDDGTIDVFTLDVEVYVPPAGVFDTLVKLREPEDGVLYVLTSKHQSVARYSEDGWLLSVSDASGNTITCQYDDDILVSVTDATANDGLSRPGRKLEFDTDVNGRLNKITDPQYNNGAGREWVLTRSSINEAFIELTDPLNHDVNIGYDLHGRITSLSDKNGKTTYLHYTDAKLVEVDDPYPLTTDVNFEYTDLGSGTSKTEYTDRKNKVWTYNYSADDNLVSMTNPLSKTWSAAYTATEPQLLHHATSVTNPLNKTWAMVWDEMGNLETSTDPLGHTTTRTYDGLNNLTSVTPPLNDEGDPNPAKTVIIEYEDEFNPTLPTKIIEPSADGYEDPAETIISYHHSDGPLMSDPAENGKVERVTDPNGVQTVFEYDDWGQPSQETENPQAVIDIPYNEWFMTTTYDASGHLTGSSAPSNGGGRGCSTIQTDAGGNQSSTACSACAALMIPGVPAGPMATWSSSISYDPMGRPLSATREVEDMQHLAGFSYEQSERTYSMSYDAVGRPTTASMITNEPGFSLATPAPTLTRMQSVSYNDSTGTTTYTGPDGEAIVTSTDDCSRTYQVTRTLPTGRLLTTTYTYDDAGQVDTVTNGNNTTTKYTYDHAGRVKTVTHRRGTSGAIFLKQIYTWTPDGLLLMVAEEDALFSMFGIAEAITFYSYDNRNRLIGEERVDYGDGMSAIVIEYNRAYTYDLGGNRLTKLDAVNGTLTTYRYDVSAENEDNVDYGQHSNRLLYYKTQTTGGSPTTVEEGWYHYGAAGHVNRFIKWKASDGMSGSYKRVHAYAFHYTKAGQLWIAVSMRGELGIGGDPDNCAGNNYAELTKQYDLPEGSVLQEVIGVAAMEYRYDSSGRQRYMVRPRMPDEELQPIGGANAGTWHDFVGDEIYGSYNLTFVPEDPPEEVSLEVENKMSYLAGVGYDDMNMHTPTSQPVYEHGDQIGTVRRLTATDPATPPSAPLLARATYTAFGEVIDQTVVPGSDGNATFRAGYAGAWGYQAGDPDTVTIDVEGTYWADGNGDLIAAADPMTELGWLHVGERYYDPACGRFMMRDPIGIDGGINVYAYVENCPTDKVDPTGMHFWPPNTGRLRYGPSRVGWGPTGKGVYRYAFRAGSRGLHLYGLKGAAAFGGCVLGSVAVGATIGIGLNEGVGALNNGYRLSDGFGDILYRWFGETDDHYDPWGH